MALYSSLGQIQKCCHSSCSNERCARVAVHVAFKYMVDRNAPGAYLPCVVVNKTILSDVEVCLSTAAYNFSHYSRPSCSPMRFLVTVWRMTCDLGLRNRKTSLYCVHVVEM